MGKAVRTILQLYAYSWFSLFLSTLALCVVCNAIWTVKLYEVADVNLSLTLSIAIVYFIISLILLGYRLIEGQFLIAGFLLLYSLIYVVLPTSNVAAFVLYGYLGGHPLGPANDSMVYDWYVQFAHSAVAHLGRFIQSVVGQHWSAPVVSRMVSFEQMPTWIGALAALGSFIVAAMRRGESAARSWR